MDNAKIGKLEIEIEASSTKAVQNIKALSDSFNRLKKTLSEGTAEKSITDLSNALKSLKEVSSIKIGKGLTNSISALSGAMKAVKPEDISRLGQIGRSLQTFNNVGQIKLYPSFANNLVLLTAAINEIKNDSYNKLSGIADALSKFNNIGKIRISPDLGNNLRDIALSVGTVSDDAIERLDKLTISLQRLANVDIRGAAKAMRGKGVTKQTTTQPLTPQDSETVSQGASQATARIENLEQELGKVKDSSKNAFKGMAADQILAMSKTDLLSAKIYSLKSELDNAVKTGKSQAKIASLAAQIHRLEAQKAKINIDTKGVDKAIKKLSYLWGFLKRVAFYNVLQSALKAVNEAFREGIENAYEYSRLVGGELAPALDRIASASLQAKNQLGAAWGEVLQALEPVIVQLLHLVTKLAQAFTWLFAVLGGKDTYLVANETATAWKKATGAAKEYQKTLLGIDEINRLNGAGGGGASTPDYSSMFHEEPTNFKMPDLKEKIQKIIDKVKDLDQWLKSLSSPSVVIHLALEWAKEKLGDVSTALENLLAKNPYIVTVGVLVPSLAPVYELAYTVETVLADSPYLVTVEALVPALAYEALEKLSEALEVVKADAAVATEAIKARYYKLQTSTVTAWEAMRVTVEKEWRCIVTATQKAEADVTSAVKTMLDNARQNITTFTTETVPGWGKWAQVVAAMANAVFSNVSQNVYLGLQNAANNVVSFLNETGANIHSWASGTLRNIASWANGVIQSVGSALRSAWENFKNFRSATGQAISGWWSENKAWVIPTAITAAVVVGAITLAPATGGASLAAAAAFKNGGFPEDGLFFANHGELVGQFSNGRTAVANNKQITEGIADAVYNAFMEAFAATGGNTNRDDRSVNIYLDGKQIATTTMRYQRQYARATGG